jgi:hypothetical protein
MVMLLLLMMMMITTIMVMIMMMILMQVRAMREMVQGVAKVPLQLEALDHAPQIEHALKKIFDTYVKGNSAPAEMVRRRRMMLMMRMMRRLW